MFQPEIRKNYLFIGAKWTTELGYLVIVLSNLIIRYPLEQFIFYLVGMIAIDIYENLVF